MQNEVEGSLRFFSHTVQPYEGVLVLCWLQYDLLFGELQLIVC